MNTTPRSPMIEGVTVTVKGVSLIVPPFNIRRSKQTGNDRAALRAATSFDSPEAIAAMVHIAGVALRANYPDLTDPEIEDELRIEDLSAILQALGKANGGDDAKGETIGATDAATPSPTGIASSPNIA